MWNSILEILKQKVKQGVEVRFLYDGTCSFNNPYNYAKTMEEYGIQCRVFNQIKPVLSTVQNNRDHRKITVIDGETAFTGGINLKDAYINAEVICSKNEKTTFFGFYYFKRRSKTKTR